MDLPLTDVVIIAVARLVDDSQGNRRDPSHSDLEFEIRRSGLTQGDPASQSQSVGKAKRVRSTLSWAIEHDAAGGQRLVKGLLTHVRGCGGFRDSSPNFVGADAITDLTAAFSSEGFTLTPDGEVIPLLLDQLSGATLTRALESYVRRAKRGAEDAALVTGTGKDLLEATAAHILVERFGSYTDTANFPTLLGQTFAALQLSTTQHAPQPGDPPQKRLERAIFETACAVNALRNKTGTGHGRPFLASLAPHEARAAVELMGTISEYLLAVHKAIP